MNQCEETTWAQAAQPKKGKPFTPRKRCARAAIISCDDGKRRCRQHARIYVATGGRLVDK
jgi:hypothetical protein